MFSESIYKTNSILESYCGNLVRSKASRGTAQNTNTIAAPRGKRPTEIVIPIDLSSPPLQRLDALHTLLQVKSAHQVLFRNLTTEHFSRYHDLPHLQIQPQTGLEGPLTARAALFLQLYGSRLWPSDLKLRSHLCQREMSTQPGNFWTCKRGQFGPEYKVDGIPKPSLVAWWRKRLGGRVLSAEESVGFSKLGAVMLAYFSALADANLIPTSIGGQDEEQILERIIGEPESDNSFPHIVDRDSSPEIPLRIVHSRSKSSDIGCETRISVASPGPENHQSSIDAGKPCCVRKGCQYRRRSMGIMIGCENDQCPIEWFHLECVGFEGQDLQGVEWKCLDCSGIPSLGAAAEDQAAEIESQTTGSTEKLPDTINEPNDPNDANQQTLSEDQEMLLQGQQRLPVAGAESSRLSLSSEPPSADPVQDDTTPDIAQLNTIQSAQASYNSPTALVVNSMEQTSLTAEQQAADDTFIQDLQSSLSTAASSNPAQIDNVHAGLSSNFGSNMTPASGNNIHYSPYATDAMEIEPSVATFQASSPPNPPPSRRPQSVRRVPEQMSSSGDRTVWNDSSTGLHQAMQNVSQSERSYITSNPMAHSSEQGSQQRNSRQSMDWASQSVSGQYCAPSPTTAAHLRQEYLRLNSIHQRMQDQRSGSHGMINSPYRQHHQPSSNPATPHLRQQSLATPPPPLGSYRTSDGHQHTGTTSSQPLTQQQAPSMPNVAQSFIFATVTPLPPQLWVLPTPETTLQSGATAKGECTEWEGAMIGYLLRLTDGMGGLPFTG